MHSEKEFILPKFTASPIRPFSITNRGTYSLVWSVPLNVGSQPWSAVTMTLSPLIHNAHNFSRKPEILSTSLQYPTGSRLWPYYISVSTRFTNTSSLDAGVGCP